jgi:FADH2-dependent halogenase
MSYDCEVIVIGGGPAGASAAAWLARAGRGVVLLERDRFPRFHIGESLLASVNEPLAAIGAVDLVSGAGFQRKWGATFITPGGSIEQFADFDIAAEVPQPQTWQVVRARFDELLLRHAAASGADVREQHRALDVTFDTAGVTVTCARGRDAGDDGSGGGGSALELRAQVVIDASGRASLVSRKFGLRVDEPSLANVAIFSHFRGVQRAEGRRAGDIRVIARTDRGWFWLIPLEEDLMSVGVVLPRETFKAVSQTPPDALLAQAIFETPAVARLMSRAERCWPARVERDFSYGARAYAGDRWILVGDAGSFLDPVFSSGVAVALESGVEGARAVHDGLARGDLSARAFRTFAGRQRARYMAFRRFVRGFYTPPFRDLFFGPDPPKRIFRAVVTVFAGYWRPSWTSRVWIALFFLSVRLQDLLHFTPSHVEADVAEMPVDAALEKS